MNWQKAAYPTSDIFVQMYTHVPLKYSQGKNKFFREEKKSSLRLPLDAMKTPLEEKLNLYAI